MTPHAYEEFVSSARVQLKWRRLASVDAIEPYVRRMMVNLYLDWRRGSWLSRVLLRPFADEASRVPDEHVDQNAERDAIWQALARLPRQQRAALVLRYYEDLPDAEIAEALGCSVGTVRGYISRGLATLRSAGDTEMISRGNR